MDRNISLAVIRRRTTQDGQLMATPGDWQRPFVIALGIWARFVSPRQLEETALALRIRHAMLRWTNPSYLCSISSPNYRSRRKKGFGFTTKLQDPINPEVCYVKSSLSFDRDIRLLEVQPGVQGSAIQVQVKSCSLNDNLDFVALSYAWGDSGKHYGICCNNEEFLVTSNLYEALQQIRSPTKTLILWIDAICIDQTNATERSSQVRLMGEIYNRASQVYVWLGVEADKSACGMNMLENICSVSKSFKGDRLSYSELIEAGVPPADDEDWKALESIFSRAWWTRMWIVQEICVSQHALFICGSATIDSRDLFQACAFINDSAISVTTGISSGSSAYLSALHERRASGIHSDLLRLLIDTRSFAVSDKRDKIYALLGLCSAREALSISIDYEKPKEEIYRSLAMSLMRGGSLDILTAVSDPFWRDISFTTSWVPDWSLVPQVIELLRPSNSISAYASCGSSANVRVASDGTTLFAEGTLADIVAETHKPYLFQSMYERRKQGEKLIKMLPDDWIEGLGGETLIRMGIRLLCWERAALRLNASFTEDSLTAFLRTITADMIENSDLKALYKSFCMVQLFIRPDRGLTMTDAKNSCIFSKAFHRASWGRTMFITKQGYLGLGPYTIRSGDQVVILKGGRTPYILRKKRDHHLLVGECYVHGIMHGEAFGDDVELETFAIK